VATKRIRGVLAISKVFAGAFAAAWVTGCAGYKLGPTNGIPAREKSVQVNPFSDETLQPRVADAVNQQIRKELMRDGTYTIATHNDGDIIVTGSIVGFQRYEISFASNDILTVRDYRLVLSAAVIARERNTGRVILERGARNPVLGNTIIRVSSDLTSTERQAMPLLAQDLAKNITALLVDGTW
jgi:hypothetical protein